MCIYDHLTGVYGDDDWSIIGHIYIAMNKEIIFEISNSVFFLV